jgi:hypothetical protein
MPLQGHDTWAKESPKTERLIHLNELEKQARGSRTALEQAGNAAHAVLTNPWIAERPDLRDMIRAAALRIGALAIEEG